MEEASLIMLSSKRARSLTFKLVSSTESGHIQVPINIWSFEDCKHGENMLNQMSQDK